MEGEREGGREGGRMGEWVAGRDRVWRVRLSSSLTTVLTHSPCSLWLTVI